MPKRIVNAGERFSRLAIIRELPSKRRGRKNRRFMLCKCDCGNTTGVMLNDLVTGNTKSCGCLSVETSKAKATTHGLREHPLYEIWSTMKRRCHSKSCREYKWYGAKGVCVCSSWRKSFLAFYEWSMNAGWSPGMSIERLDVTRGYEEGNCTFIPRPLQNKNKRNTIRVTYLERTQCLTDWCKELGVRYGTVFYKLKSGKTFEEAILSCKPRYRATND